MKPRLNQEIEIEGSHFKSHVRSVMFFQLPIVLGSFSIVSFLMTVLGLYSTTEQRETLDWVLIGFFFLFFLVVFISFLWVTYLRIKDASNLEVKVKTVLGEKIRVIRNKKTTYDLVYLFQGKTYYKLIPDKWAEELVTLLPSELVIYETYYSGIILKIEVIGKNQTFSVVGKKLK